MKRADLIRSLGLPPDATEARIIDAMEREAYRNQVENFVEALVPALRDAVRGCAFDDGKPNGACFEKVKSLLDNIPYVKKSHLMGPSPQAEEARNWARERERYEAGVMAFVATVEPAIRDAVRACACVPEDPVSPVRIVEIKALIDAVKGTMTSMEEVKAPPIPSSDAAPMEATSVSSQERLREPPALPPRTPRDKREALAAAIAMQFAGIEVKGKAGAKAIGFPDDETIAGYLADSQPWGKVWKAQREWAQGTGGDWRAVFIALREWVLASDD